MSQREYTIPLEQVSGAPPRERTIPLASLTPPQTPTAPRIRTVPLATISATPPRERFIPLAQIAPTDTVGAPRRTSTIQAAPGTLTDLYRQAKKAVSDIWDRTLEPLIPESFVTDAVKTMEAHERAEEQEALRAGEAPSVPAAAARGFMTGMTEGGRTVVRGLSSPLNLGLQALGLGTVKVAGALARNLAALPKLRDAMAAAKVAQDAQQSVALVDELVATVERIRTLQTAQAVMRGTEAVVGAGFTAEGVANVVDAPTFAEKALGVAQTAGGAAMVLAGVPRARVAAREASEAAAFSAGAREAMRRFEAASRAAGAAPPDVVRTPPLAEISGRVEPPPQPPVAGPLVPPGAPPGPNVVVAGPSPPAAPTARVAPPVTPVSTGTVSELVPVEPTPAAPQPPAPVVAAPAPPRELAPAVRPETAGDLEPPRVREVQVEAGTSPERPAEVSEPRKFSSTQVKLPPPIADAIVAKAATIPEEDLAPNGRAGATPDTAPHVTVKYGLHTTDAEEVRTLLADEPPITVTLGKTSFFPNSESGSGDVLKVDVNSPDLRRLNKKIADALEVTDTHPTYQPHVTIAYVKEGLGKKYADDESLKGQTATLNSVQFSSKDGTQVDIPLTGQPKEITDAIQARPQQKGDQVQHQGRDRSGEAPQTGRGDRVTEGGQGQAAVAAQLPEPPTLEWRGPARESPEYARVLQRADELSDDADEANEKYRAAQVDVEKHKYGTKARETAERRRNALQEELHRRTAPAQKARDEAYDLRLQNALSDPATPVEVKWAVAAKIAVRRKTPLPQSAYELVRDEAARLLKQQGATAEEALSEGMQLASSLTTYPLSDRYHFAKAIPLSMELIHERRQHATANERLKALEQEYGIQSTKATRRVGSAVGESEIERSLQEAEADFKASREKSDAEQRAKDEKAREAKEANLAQAVEWEKAGRLVWRRIGDEGWEAVEGTKAKIPSAPRDVQFSVFKDPRSGRWAVVENTTGLAAGFGTSRKAALDAATAKIGEVGVQKFKDTLTKALATTPEKPSLTARAQGGGGTSGDASTTLFTETEPRRPGHRPPVAGADVIRPIEFPELVDFARELQGVPGVVKGFRGDPKYGLFRGARGIQLLADLFKKGNEVQLASTLAHEIGHLVDYLPHRTLKRGNLLGRLQSLLSFMRHSFTAPDGTTVKLQEVRAELMDLSATWRPWNRETAAEKERRYRDSARELYADALSVLLNNPGMLESRAPTFYKQFFDLLDRKPEVQRAYFDLQEQLSGTREELIARRRAGVRRMAKAGDVKAIELEQQRQKDAALGAKDLIFHLKVGVLSKLYPAIDRIAALKKQGIYVPDHANPVYFLQELGKLPVKLKGFMERTFAPVYRNLNDGDITWNAFHEALLYERIIAGDRSEIANPRGLSPSSASELYGAFKRELGPSKMAVLKDAMTRFRAAVAEVAGAAHEEGLYSDEMYAEMQANPAYATYRVIEHMDEAVTSRVYKQVGTLRDVSNVATATVLKTLATARAIAYNEAVRTGIELLQQRFPDQIQPAKTQWNGRRMAPVESKEPKLELLTYMKGGKTVGVYVDPYWAAMYRRDNLGEIKATLKILDLITGQPVFAPVFTTFNLGFHVWNAQKDFWRAFKNRTAAMGGRWNLARQIYFYRKGEPLARVRAFGLSKKPSVRTLRAWEDMVAADETGILGGTYSSLIGNHPEDTEIEQLLSRLNVMGFHDPARARFAKPFLWAADLIENIGNYIQSLSPAAALYEFKGKGRIQDISPSQRDEIRRRFTSPPDPSEAGTWTPITNRLFLFSRAILASWRADWEVATDFSGKKVFGIIPTTPSGWWAKTAVVALLPKLLMYGAMIGLGGEALRRMYEKMTEYDRTTYLPIPLGEEADGKLWYIKFPLDEADRFIGGLFWKALRLIGGDKHVLDTVVQVFDYTAGQIPSLAPGLHTIASTAEMIAGQNPRDRFRGRDVLTRDEQLARGWPAWRRFLGWEFQQLGGSVLWKFYPGEERPTTKSAGQRIFDILNLPGVSFLTAPLTRFIRVTNYGETEIAREAVRHVQAEQAGRRISERDAVREAFSTFQALPAAQRNPRAVRVLAGEIAVSLYGKDPAMATRRFPSIEERLTRIVARGQVEPFVEAFLSASGEEERAAVLSTWAERRGVKAVQEAVGAR